MASTSLFLILITLNVQLLLLLSPQIHAQTSGPAASPPGPLNLTGILDKGGQFKTFIRLLNESQALSQLANQLNNSNQGMTIFAPTDNAFNNLASGAINGLNSQDKSRLLLYHVLPKYYTLTDLETVSNPVPTQGSDSNGVWGLNFTGRNNQVNVSTGVVETQINNALRQDSPLAVYAVDKVLLPSALFGANSPTSAPSPTKTPSGTTTNTTTTPAADSPSNSTSASGRTMVGWNLVLGLGLTCMGALS